MADEADDTDGEITYLGPKTIVRTDDDRTPSTEMEQRDDESEDEFFKRMEKDSRGTTYDRVYLHTSMGESR